MIEQWLKAIRDHPARPPALQCHVLTMLALRLDWRTGRGFASVQQLGADADACERTVRYATSWARRAELLLRTRRGHYISAGVVIASEWQLTQPAAECLLGQTQPANGDDPTGKSQQPNRQLEHPHQESSPSQPSTSALRARPSAQRAKRRADGPKAPRTPRADPKPLRAPPCPQCGGPFSQDQLADPGFRRMALAGNAVHAGCHPEAQAAP